MTNRVFAALVLLVLSPVFLLIWIAILVTMGTPALFLQARSGLHGRSFNIVKFRTMRYPKTPDQPDEERITRVGAFLRATSLDELPSLWNILHGEMVFVGPRPFIAAYAEHLTPHQFRRHEVKPGLTGWAQINGRNALSWEEKFDLDVWYVEHKRLSLDLKILLKTPSRVIFSHGVAHGDHRTMPVFTPRDEAHRDQESDADA